MHYIHCFTHCLRITAKGAYGHVSLTSFSLCCRVLTCLLCPSATPRSNPKGAGTNPVHEGGGVGAGGLAPVRCVGHASMAVRKLYTLSTPNRRGLQIKIVDAKLQLLGRAPKAPYPKNGLPRSFAHAQWAYSMGVGMWHIGGGLKRVGKTDKGCRGGSPKTRWAALTVKPK